MQNFLFISIGAILGANTRYWVVDLLEKKLVTALPIGTILVNISGSFLLGLFITLANRKNEYRPKTKPVIHNRLFWGLHYLFNLCLTEY